MSKKINTGDAPDNGFKEPGLTVPLKFNVAMFNKHQDSSSYKSPRPLLTPSFMYEQRDIPMGVF